jgi:hypothetical protein
MAQANYNGTAQAFWKDQSFTSYTGATNGKRVRDASGYYKPQLQNVVAMSERLDSAYWTLSQFTAARTTAVAAPSGVSTIFTLTESGTTSSKIAQTPAITLTPNISYTGSYYVRAGSGGRFPVITLQNTTDLWIAAVFDLSDGLTTSTQTAVGATSGTVVSASKEDLGNGWFRLKLTGFTSGTGFRVIISVAGAASGNTFATNGTVSVTGNVSNFIYASGAQLNPGMEVLTYAPTTAHNLCLQSQVLGTSWTATDITVGTNDQTAPDGTATADSLTEGVAGTALLRSTAFTVPASAVVTASMYLKASTATWVRFTLADGSDTNGLRGWFNLATGAKGTLSAIGSGTATSSTITDVGNSWYRVDITGVCSTSTSLTISLSSASADASNTRVNSVVYTGWGAQAELASAAGKYTPTTTAAVYSQYYALPREWNAAGVCQGILCEEARTNLALFSRDCSNAAWTKTNVTAAYTATGVDNVANSASTLTATAGNGTVLQSITSASAARLFSAFVKRRTGTGVIEMTQDNGGTWTDVTSQVTSSWTRISVPVATVTNPIVGFRIVTSGDAIDVDICQSEAGSWGPTSPIVTGSASVTRAIDVPLSALRGVMPLNAEAGTLFARYVQNVSNAQSTTAQSPVTLWTGANANVVSITSKLTSATTAGAQVIDGSVSQAAITVTGAGIPGGHQAAVSYQANLFDCSVDGVAGTQDTSGTVPSLTELRLNGYSGVPFNGYIQQVMYLPVTKTSAQLNTITSNNLFF